MQHSKGGRVTMVRVFQPPHPSSLPPFAPRVDAGSSTCPTSTLTTSSSSYTSGASETPKPIKTQKTQNPRPLFPCLFPIPIPLCPVPFALYPLHYTLYPTPCIQYPVSYKLCHLPLILPMIYTPVPCPIPCALYPVPYTLCPMP